MKRKKSLNWAWYCMPVIPARRRRRQEDWEIKASRATQGSISKDK